MVMLATAMRTLSDAHRESAAETEYEAVSQARDPGLPDRRRIELDAHSYDTSDSPVAGRHLGDRRASGAAGASGSLDADQADHADHADQADVRQAEVERFAGGRLNTVSGRPVSVPNALLGAVAATYTG
jgi:hypothetical protein